MKLPENRYSLFALLTAIFVIGYLVFQAIPLNVFAYDVLGYYLYLPTAFRYEDLAINDFEHLKSVLSNYGTAESFSHAFKVENGNYVMKFPMGLAVLYYPFYVIGHNLAICLKYPTDGFSLPYQLSILYGCYLYTIIGLIALRKALLFFLKDKIVAITLLLVVFGTNYLLHVSIHAQPAMSHNLLFSLHALTCYYTIKWHQSFKLRYILGFGVTIGLAAISRPPEILIAIVPILFGVYNIQTLKEKVKILSIHRKQVIACFATVFIIVSYQLVYWKIITGSFLFDSYSEHLNEGFNFKHPYILEFLFSFRKGWLVYTPIMIFAVIGFYFLYKNGRLWFWALFAYFIVNFYVMSSWSCWWYGISYSSRAIIPAYVVLSVPFGYALNKIFSNKMKFLFAPVFLILVALNIFQSWQASRGILEGSRMTRAYYKSVFLQRTLPTDEQKKLLLFDKYSSSDILKFDEADLPKYRLVYSQEENFDLSTKEQPNIVDSLCFSKNNSFVTNNNYSFAGNITKRYNEITNKSYLICRISARVYMTDNPKQLEARLVLNMLHKGKTTDFRCIDIRKLDLKQNQWNKIQFYYLTPDFWDKSDVIQGYFWNLSGKPIFVDNIKFEALEPIIDDSVF